MNLRRISFPLLAAMVLATIVGSLVGLVVHHAPTKSVTAVFKVAPGLYTDNHVDVLGIPVGKVDSITPGLDGVKVRISIPANLDIPGDVKVVLVAPNVVNDRYIQLDPPYTGGPKLEAGAVIPTSRTFTPVSVDDILNNLDNLAKALGPGGANGNGALSNLLDSLSNSVNGQGQNFHTTIVALSKALSAVASNPQQVTGLLDHLGTLTQALADHSNTYTAFANDLASVSSELSSETPNIASALSNLQQALGQLADFVQTNKGSLGATVANLQAFAGTIAQQQKALAQAFDVGPLALQNLSAAIDNNAPGGPALRARYDPSSTSAGFIKQLCGSVLIRFLAVAGKQSQANPLDLDCAVQNGLGTLALPPNASGPNLSLSALIGRGL
ncbi:MAG: MCE family protein [Acidimicrobiales bacterium]